MDLYQKQIELEDEYSTASIVAGQEAVLDAFKQGRATDIGTGRILLAKAYEVAKEAMEAYLNDKSVRGLLAKYKKLLRIAPTDVIVMAGLREVIGACANPEPVALQTILRTVGKTIEAESMIVFMQGLNPVYLNRTIEYLDSAGTHSVNHRYRTIKAGAENLGIEWEQWSSEVRVGVARLLLSVLYESTGLFKWIRTDKVSPYFVAPSDVLAQHLESMQDSARAVVRFPPMLLKPVNWQDQNIGGYLTDWMRAQAPMCGLRYIAKEQRKWVLENLSSERTQPLRDAMNKTQCTAYRVNTEVLAVLQEALASRLGILGLPSNMAKPQPVFPFPETWIKTDATTAELEQFQFWKTQMASWYTSETKRIGRKVGILSRLRELVRYKDESELYFPTFVDWRGRMYFRSMLNPQANDAVKGCLEFSEGKPLGERGLFWLKVHVANSCGYDKHTPEIKAKWTDDNWEMICDFINNPLDVDAPEADTAFTLLQAGFALQKAYTLADPTEYICHVPVPMDATCSGLQHLSALTRDTVGAEYTNLVDNKADQKADIYTKVGAVAQSIQEQYVTDDVVKKFWVDHNITRNMAKKPVMTFVYGSTLLSTIDGLALELSDSGVEPIRNEAGAVAYSLTALASPIGKALREGVVQTVPKANEMMKYLQTITRRHKDNAMRWITPIGMPVVNWAEGNVAKRVWIQSMGIDAILFMYKTGTYDTRIASNGIVPNFVHSMDSCHLCMTINHCTANILPIHDSFATHPCDVDTMHESLRNTFVGLYTNYKCVDFTEYNNVDLEEYPLPVQGNFDLNLVTKAPFMFC